MAVVGVKDAKWGERPMAYVVLSEEVPKDLTGIDSILIDYCRKNLSHFKCPDSIKFVEELPKTG